MELKPLSRDQIREVYHKYITADFPDDERKPLAMIYKSLSEGRYQCFGCFRENSMLGYAFFVKIGNRYMLDYFAVLPDIRGQGNGSAMLHLLLRQLTNAEAFLVEVEDPAYSQDNAERDIRTKRLSFYLKNGFVDTGVSFLTFGVPYRLLEANVLHSSDETAELYRSVYRTILPAFLFRKNVEVLSNGHE